MLVLSYLSHMSYICRGIMRWKEKRDEYICNFRPFFFSRGDYALGSAFVALTLD